MAVTVPRYEQGQVRQQNLPSARYSASGADVSAGSIGRGLQQVGGVLGQIADQEKRKVDVAAVMEAESQLRAYQNTMLFGDGSGQNVGAFGTKGRDSFGLPERILPELDKRRAEIAGKLRADQRAMFEQRTADWGVQTQGDLLRHVARESDAYTKETTKAYIDSSAQTAVLYYNNPERVDAEITRAQDAYLVGNPGDPPEATRLALQTIEQQSMSTSRELFDQRAFDLDALNRQSRPFVFRYGGLLQGKAVCDPIDGQFDHVPGGNPRRGFDGRRRTRRQSEVTVCRLFQPAGERRRAQSE